MINSFLPNNVQTLLTKLTDKGSLDAKLAAILQEHVTAQIHPITQSDIHPNFCKNMFKCPEPDYDIAMDLKWPPMVAQSPEPCKKPPDLDRSPEEFVDFLEEYIKVSVEFDLSYDDFCKEVFRILCSNKSNERLQNEFFEWLGFDSFEFISNLLMHRNYFTKPEISK